MICERCKNKEASFFYNETINGKKKSVALCADCAAEGEKNGEFSLLGHSYVGLQNPFESVNSIFGSLFGYPQLGKTPVGEVKRCRLCAASFNDLVSAGKVGCPECYRTFAKELEKTVSRIHGTVLHTGSAPERYKSVREKKNKVETLKAELKASIEAENYERAAEIRDELRSLNEEKEG